jgi:serine/threonine-protein kinase RsbT
MINAEPTGPAQVQEISADDDVVRVRQLVRAAAVATKLSLVDQTKLVTAASELARNTLVHGGGGRAEVQQVNNGRRNGLLVVFTDEGPGIDDVDRALTDGYSTRGGLGLGLSGARRLMDDFELVTAVGEGTTVSAVKWER